MPQSKMQMRHVLGALGLTFAAAGLGAPSVQAQAVGTATGLPVPRFVSVKADKVNVHIGPAKNYEVKWIYQRAGLPVEIVAEFENWRRIRDSDGTDGWVYHSLLSGRRTGIVITRSKDDLVAIHNQADAKSSIKAKLQPGVTMSVKRCGGQWCRVVVQGVDGYIAQARLWGVYPNEKVD